MLCRAVGLTATAGWATDRLFELGLDNVVNINGTNIPTVQLGGWIALSAWVAVSATLAVASLVTPTAMGSSVGQVTTSSAQL